MLPDWLEPPLDLGGTNINDTYEKLYSIYQGFVPLLKEIAIDGKNVVFDRQPDSIAPQYERAFIHFVTRMAGGTRVYDEARARKIHWIVPLLEHYRDENVKSFWSKGPKGDALYIWLEEFNYVLILKNMKSEKYRDSRIIVTAYNVDQEYNSYLRKKYSTATKVL